MEGRFQDCPLHYRWLYKKGISQYATLKFESQRNIENDDKKSDERDQMGENKEETLNTYIEVLKLWN